MSMEKADLTKGLGDTVAPDTPTATTGAPQECPKVNPCLLLSISPRTGAPFRRRRPMVSIKTPSSCASNSCKEADGDKGSRRREVSFCLKTPSSRQQTPARVRPRPAMIMKTPSSCASSSRENAFTPNAAGSRTPRTPEPNRQELRSVSGGVSLIFFDFDGTLTSVPGEKAQRRHKRADLKERAPLLQSRLEALQSAGITLGIITKSQEATVRSALVDAGLDGYFEGPVIGTAIGFEGKAGFIEEFLAKSSFASSGEDQADLKRILLVDDDVRELDRAREKGIQTFSAPKNGGLQEDDFIELLGSLGVEPQKTSQGRRSGVLGWLRRPRGGVCGSSAEVTEPEPAVSCG